MYFIATGLAKMVYLTHDGKDFIKSFLADGAFAGSLSAQLTDAPSPFSLICIEPCLIERAPYTALKALFQSSTDAQAFGLSFFQTLALRKEQREHTLLCLSPEDRFRMFMDSNPALVPRITQADLAKHLGITPVALSRIKKRLSL